MKGQSPILFDNDEHEEKVHDSSLSFNLLRNRRKSKKRQNLKSEKKLLDDSFKWHKSELGIGKGVTPDDLDLKKY